MKTRRPPWWGLVLALVGSLGGAAIAQDTGGALGTPPTPAAQAAAGTSQKAPTPPTPATPSATPTAPPSAASPLPRASDQNVPAVADVPQPPRINQERESGAKDTVRVGVDYTLPANGEAADVVVLGGSALIEGHVERDVVVILGGIHLASAAVLDGDLVVVGGTVTVDAGAVVAQDLVVVAGTLESAPGFMPGGEQTIVGGPVLGDGLRVLMPWATRGLLWGRPLVPDLPWLWALVALVFLVYGVLNFVFDGPVRASVEKLTERPLTAFLVGLLVLALIGPVVVVLAVSFIGLAVIPFIVCALCIAGTLGKVGVLRALGGRVIRQDELDNRAQSARSFVIGFVTVAVMYMVPVFGFVAFGTLGVLGLGAAALAFVDGIRRENPAPTVEPTPVPVTRVGGESPNHTIGGGPLETPASRAVAAPVIPADLTLLPKATFMNRLGAFGLDLVLVLMTLGLLGLTRPNRTLLLLLLYRIGLWAWMGTTVGGIICQLRVVRTDGAPLRLADALVRGLSSVFSFAVLGIGYLWIIRDAERQAWHDKIAGTFVVKVPKHWPRT